MRVHLFLNGQFPNGGKAMSIPMNHGIDITMETVCLDASKKFNLFSSLVNRNNDHHHKKKKMMNISGSSGNRVSMVKRAAASSSVSCVSSVDHQLIASMDGMSIVQRHQQSHGTNGVSTGSSSSVAAPSTLPLRGGGGGVLPSERLIHSRERSTGDDSRASMEEFQRVSLYTIKGTLIEDPSEIVHDEVLIVVPQGEEFQPPLPLEYVIAAMRPPTSVSIELLQQQQQYRQDAQIYGQVHPFQSPFFNYAADDRQQRKREGHRRVQSIGEEISLGSRMESLPSDLYHMVFTFLDHRDLCLVTSLVCRLWFKHSNSEKLWRELCANVVYYRERRRVLYKQREEAARMSIAMNQSHPPGATVSGNDDDQDRNVDDDNDGSNTAGNMDRLRGRDSSVLDEDSDLDPGSIDLSGDADGSPRLIRRVYRSNADDGDDDDDDDDDDNVTDDNDDSIEEEDADEIGDDNDNNAPERLRQMILQRVKPPMYRSWKTYYRYYVLWSSAVVWDTAFHGPDIKFENANRTISRADSTTYHWQSVKAVTPIRIPTEEEKRRNGVFSGNPDDIAVFEFELLIDRFDKSHSNGWWIVIGLETDAFNFRESAPTNLIGYDKHLGFGYAGGNGDALHCYSNLEYRAEQPFTCEPLRPWVNVPFHEGDTVRARLKYYNKVVEDAVDPVEYVGATLEFFVNDRSVGQIFRNITGTVYPAVSLLPNQQLTLRNCLGL